MSTYSDLETQGIYRHDYVQLKQCFSYETEAISIPNTDLEIKVLPFESSADDIFPNDPNYYAPKLSGSSLNLNSVIFEGPTELIMQMSDKEVVENNTFKYILIKPQSPQRSKGLIMLFHGLNEKDWSKYLPWAKKLIDLTGKAVILFPIAFHINRALPAWQDSRLMQQVSKHRQALFQNIQASSFTNAAMSTRLHFAPARFFLSGLATYKDIIQLTKQIKSDLHPWVEPQSRIDFLGYSAGAFLVQILMMANRDRMFDDSRGIMFCGGPLFSRMYLTSRYIMDSAAHQALQDFYVDNFDRNLLADPNLANLFEAAYTGGKYFKSMLSESYRTSNVLRKQRLEELSDRLTAIALAQDTIMPPQEVQASMIGSRGTAVIPCHTFDFDYPYTHMNPFPYIEKIQSQVDEAFQRVFDQMAESLT